MAVYSLRLLEPTPPGPPARSVAESWPCLGTAVHGNPCEGAMHLREDGILVKILALGNNSLDSTSDDQYWLPFFFSPFKSPD